MSQTKSRGFQSAREIFEHFIPDYEQPSSRRPESLPLMRPEGQDLIRGLALVTGTERAVLPTRGRSRAWEWTPGTVRRHDHPAPAYRIAA